MSAAVATEIALPQLSEGMEEGTLVAWLKPPGSDVAAGDPLVEIETDKSTVAHPASAAGRLEILVPEGETVAVGTIICRLLPPGAATDAVDGAPATAAPAALPSASTSPAREEPVAVAAPAPGHDRVPATPLARRLAARHGLDVAGIMGSGPGGFVLRSDVLSAAGLPAAPAPAAPAGNGPAPGSGSGLRGVVTVAEPSRVQRVVAERMAESRATIPDFTMRVDVDMGLAESARDQLRLLAGSAPAPSLNDMVVKAAALALREVPSANARFRDGRTERYERVNVGIAVAAPDGLLVPVIRDADRRSLGDLAGESRRLAAAAREGAVAPEDLEGGTFTVSNLGMYGIRSFTAIINPPQAAILAVGMVRDEAVVREGELRPGRLMSLTLSGDHRVLNGVDGATLLNAIRDRLEAPLRLALG